MNSFRYGGIVHLGGVKLKTDLLENDLDINIWLERIRVSDNTKRNYLRSMYEYTECTGKSPKQLVDETRVEIKQALPIDERSIKGHLMRFVDYLRYRRFAPLTIKLYITGVRSFYAAHYIDLPKMPSHVEKARPVENNKAILTKEILRDVLRFCDPLEKAVLLVEASSGLTARELINLRIYDFKHGYDSQTEITAINVYRMNTGTKYMTFLTPEASQAVWDYLQYRNRNKTQKVFSDDGYLFIRRQIPAKFIETGNEELRKMEAGTLARMYRRISEKSLEGTPKISSLKLRKFFCTTLINAGADPCFVNFSMGHVIKDASLAYFQVTVDILRKKYAEYIPFLTIGDTLDVSKEKVAKVSL